MSEDQLLEMIILSVAGEESLIDVPDDLSELEDESLALRCAAL